MAAWFETRGVAALLTMRVEVLILRSALLRASRRPHPEPICPMLSPGVWTMQPRWAATAATGGLSGRFLRAINGLRPTFPALQQSEHLCEMHLSVAAS